MRGHARGWFGAVVALLATAVMGVPATASAEPHESIVDQLTTSEVDRCDIDAFAGTKVVSAHAPFQTVRGLAVGETWIEPLAQPVQGRVLVHGLLGDLNHLEDVPDFDIARSQFLERLHVVFYGADGAVVGETVATPDLPDLGVVAPFALPTVDLSAPAVGIQLRHRSIDSVADSVVGVCINLDEIAPDASPADRTFFQYCPHDSLDIAPDLQCGFIAVPEERSNPASRLITVFFGIMPGDGTHPDPLVYLEGGPGGPAVPFSGPILDLAMLPAADGRDVVLVDQRGTGYSNPNMACFDPAWYSIGFPEPADESTEAIDDFFNELADGCQARLRAESVDLSAYTTIENGYDVAELRIGLGVEEWNLFGGSYGTELALTVMRDSPAGVRSVVLDSVFQPEVNPFTDDEATGLLNGLSDVVATCVADVECGAAYPDPVGDINAAIAALDAEPVLVEGLAIELLTGWPEYEFGPYELLERLTVDKANPYLMALVHGVAHAPDPQARSEVVHAFVRADAEALLVELEALAEELEALADGPPPEMLLQADLDRSWGVPGMAAEFSDGMYYSVMCTEEYPFLDRGAPIPLEDDGWHPIAQEFAADWFRITECPFWDVAAEDPVVADAVSSDIPTMLLYTDVDFQTWPEWTERAAETLPNSQLFFYPALGHVVTYYDSCPQSMVAAFLSDPSADVDDACIADLPVRDYETEIPRLPPIDDRILAVYDLLFGPLG